MYKECPSSSSSVQGVSKLVHRTCTAWELAWAHVYISKQFPSLGTLSVTAWTQLVHIVNKSVSKLGTPTFIAVCTPRHWKDEKVGKKPCVVGEPQRRSGSQSANLYQASVKSTPELMSCPDPLAHARKSVWYSE